MEKDTRQLDTRVKVVTPENIAFQYRVAGPFRRLPAYLIDLALRVGICVLGFFLLSFLFFLLGISSLASFGTGLMFVGVFLVIFFYGGLFETFWNGQTPGKRLLRIRVLSVEGQAINASQAILRNILRTADMLPTGYLFGLVSATLNDRYQRLGDLACGTMVVVEEPHWLQGVAKVNEPAVLELTTRIPAKFHPDRSLARALAIYVGRRANFTPMRRMQIARYLGVPLREQLGLPHQTNLDHLLCALYNRTFVTDDLPEQSDSNSSSLVMAESVEENNNPFASTVVPEAAGAS